MAATIRDEQGAPSARAQRPPRRTQVPPYRHPFEEPYQLQSEQITSEPESPSGRRNRLKIRLEIDGREYTVHPLDLPTVFAVELSRNSGSVRVGIFDDGPFCDCPDFSPATLCKHVRALAKAAIVLCDFLVAGDVVGEDEG